MECSEHVPIYYLVLLQVLHESDCGLCINFKFLFVFNIRVRIDGDLTFQNFDSWYNTNEYVSGHCYWTYMYAT